MSWTGRNPEIGLTGTSTCHSSLLMALSPAQLPVSAFCVETVELMQQIKRRKDVIVPSSHVTDDVKALFSTPVLVSLLRCFLPLQRYGKTVTTNARKHFYRAMLCTARTVPSQNVCLSVRPSVRPSHAGIVSERLKISSKFLPSGSHSSFFSYQTLWQYSKAMETP